MKRISSKKIVDAVVPVGMAAVGYGGARVVEKLVNVGNAQSKNTIVGVTQIAIGVFLTMQKNKHIQSAGFGVALAGANAFLAAPIAKGLEAIGIKGIGAPSVGYPYKSSYNNAANSMMAGVNCPTKVIS